MNRLTPELLEQIRELKDQGKKLTDICATLGLNWSAVVANTQKDFDGNYLTAKEYNEFLAKNKGYENAYQIQKERLARKGFRSNTEYEEMIAQREGFTSRHHMRKHQIGQRQKQIENIVLSLLLPQRLGEIEKSQNWLAEELEISRVGISNYALGKNLPTPRTQAPLFLALKLDYTSYPEYMQYIEDSPWMETYTAELKKGEIIAGNIPSEQRKILTLPYKTLH